MVDWQSRFSRSPLQKFFAAVKPRMLDKHCMMHSFKFPILAWASLVLDRTETEYHDRSDSAPYAWLLQITVRRYETGKSHSILLPSNHYLSKLFKLYFVVRSQSGVSFGSGNTSLFTLSLDPNVDKSTNRSVRPITTLPFQTQAARKHALQ